MPVVVAVVPAWNEQARVAQTVRAALCIPRVDHVLVVDDGSADNTAAIAKEAGANVLSLPGHRGKGEALAAGIAAVSADIYLLLDADLGASAQAAATLLEPVLRHEADMTIARFPRTGPAGFGLARGLARRGIQGLTGWLPESPLSGQRAISSAVFKKVEMASGWCAEVGLTVDAIRNGFRVQEVPVAFQHRHTGRDWRGFLHRGRQFTAIAAVLWSRWWRWGYRHVPN